MSTQSIYCHQLIGDFQSEFMINAALYIKIGEFLALKVDVFGKLFSLSCKIGLLCVRLRADGYVLSSSH